MNIASARVEALIRAALNKRRQRFAMLDAKLTQLNPREAADAPAGTDVSLMFTRDAVRATVTVSPETSRK